jgi:hypothetical protein
MFAKVKYFCSITKKQNLIGSMKLFYCHLLVISITNKETRQLHIDRFQKNFLKT